MSEAPITRRLALAARVDGDIPEHDGDTDISRTRFLASDDTLDRWGTRIVQDWLEEGRIEPYLINPVISMSHRWGGLSVGRGEDIAVGDASPGVRAMFLTVAWDMDDEESAALAGKYARQVMHAGSVGFRSEQEIALASLDKTHPWRSERGTMLQGNHLLEFAVGVLIPGNANAIAIRGEDGTGRDEDGWLRDALYRTAPAELRDILADMLRNDPALQKVIREVAGDVTTTAPHAAEIVKRSGPLSFLGLRSS